MFFIPFDNWKTLYLIKLCYSDIFSNHHVFAFFEPSVLKEVSIFLRNSNAKWNTNTKVSKKAVVKYPLVKCSKLIWFVITVFTALFFLWLFHIFLHQCIFLKKNSKPFSKHSLSIIGFLWDFYVFTNSTVRNNNRTSGTYMNNGYTNGDIGFKTQN